MGHALMAAVKRVSNINHSFLLNSFHCHFVRPMQTTPDVTYKVNHVKFGSNFCSLSVKAVQSDKVCFLCLVCFQKPHKLEEADLCYSIYSMPTVALPQEPIIASELPENGITTLVQVQLDGFPFHVYSCMDREEYQKKLSFQPTKPKLVPNEVIPIFHRVGSRGGEGSWVKTPPFQLAINPWLAKHLNCPLALVVVMGVIVLLYKSPGSGPVPAVFYHYHLDFLHG